MDMSEEGPLCILGKDMQCNEHGEVVHRDQRMCMVVGTCITMQVRA
jgi:hypothetical protein